MPKFVIERNVPKAGEWSERERREAATQSNTALSQLGPDVQWVHSYVTDDKIYCVYNAPSEDAVREHARRSGFPADAVAPIRAMMDPVTAEPPDKR